MSTIMIVNPGPNLGEAGLVAFEERLGTRLPDAYRAFLLEFNGGRPKPDIIHVEGAPQMPTDVQVLFGIDHSVVSSRLDWNWEVLTDRLDRALLPIGTDSGGNLFCLVITGPHRGRVLYWEADRFGDLHEVATSFPEFLNALRTE